MKIKGRDEIVPVSPIVQAAHTLSVASPSEKWMEEA